MQRIFSTIVECKQKVVAFLPLHKVKEEKGSFKGAGIFDKHVSRYSMAHILILDDPRFSCEINTAMLFNKVERSRIGNPSLAA